jgi:hypothetical protein
VVEASVGKSAPNLDPAIRATRDSDPIGGLIVSNSREFAPASAISPSRKRETLVFENGKGLAMKWIVPVAAMLIAGAAVTRADAAEVYYDLIRPNGHPGPDAIFQAALDYCYNQTGADRTAPDTAEFKQCMLGRHYHWLRSSAGGDSSPPPSITYDKDSKNPAVGWHWEGGNRVCHNDCDNPEIAGSGYTCTNVVWMGQPTRKCVLSNHM